MLEKIWLQFQNPDAWYVYDIIFFEDERPRGAKAPLKWTFFSVSQPKKLLIAGEKTPTTRSQRGHDENEKLLAFSGSGCSTCIYCTTRVARMILGCSHPRGGTLLLTSRGCVVACWIESNTDFHIIKMIYSEIAWDGDDSLSWRSRVSWCFVLLWLSCANSPARFARATKTCAVTLAAPSGNIPSHPAMTHMCTHVLIHENVRSCIRDMHRCRDHVALAVSFPSLLLRFHGCSAFLAYLRVAIMKKGRVLMA